MPLNEEGQQLCVELINDYGVCSRTRDHVVHASMEISPREHSFKAERSEIVETSTLTNQNLRRISERSGMTVGELEILMKTRGEILKNGNKVKYKLLASVARAEGKMK